MNVFSTFSSQMKSFPGSRVILLHWGFYNRWLMHSRYVEKYVLPDEMCRKIDVDLGSEIRICIYTYMELWLNSRENFPNGFTNASDFPSSRNITFSCVYKVHSPPVRMMKLGRKFHCCDNNILATRCSSIIASSREANGLAGKPSTSIAFSEEKVQYVVQCYGIACIWWQHRNSVHGAMYKEAMNLLWLLGPISFLSNKQEVNTFRSCKPPHTNV